jgi:2-isopropylmalate synthase
VPRALRNGRYSFAAITGGTDTLGEVTIQFDVGDRRVFGRAVSTDVVEASAQAYIDAMSKIDALPEGARDVKGTTP